MCNGVSDKEGCNWGHGLSAAIKLGSLKKTVGASLIALCCVLSSPFFVNNALVLKRLSDKSNKIRKLAKHLVDLHTLCFIRNDFYD